jgi:hypothetical protein
MANGGTKHHPEGKKDQRKEPQAKAPAGRGEQPKKPAIRQ